VHFGNVVTVSAGQILTYGSCIILPLTVTTLSLWPKTLYCTNTGK